MLRLTNCHRNLGFVLMTGEHVNKNVKIFLLCTLSLATTSLISALPLATPKSFHN